MRIGPTLLQISLSNENQEREGKWKGWQIKTMKQNAIKEGGSVFQSQAAATRLLEMMNAAV